MVGALMDFAGWLKPEEIPEVYELTEDECWDALVGAEYGRLAAHANGGIDIFPVNFMVKDRQLFLRSAPGSKLVDIAHNPMVAIEVDGAHRRRHWSVVVKGKAERMSYDDEILESGVLDLETYTSSAKWNYIRITPHTVTGRRFTKAPKPRRQTTAL